MGWNPKTEPGAADEARGHRRAQLTHAGQPCWGQDAFRENGCLEELLLLLASGKISSKVNPLAVCKNIHLLPLAEVKNDLIIATAVER